MSEQKTSKQKITLSLNEKAIKHMKIQAVKENSSVSAILDELIENYLNSKGIDIQDPLP